MTCLNWHVCLALRSDSGITGLESSDLYGGCPERGVIWETYCDLNRHEMMDHCVAFVSTGDCKSYELRVRQICLFSVARVREECFPI